MELSERERIGSYIQYQLKLQGLSQKDLAEEYGCAQAAISGVIIGRPEHSGLVTIRKFIARKLGRDSWPELCAEALAEKKEVV